MVEKSDSIKKHVRGRYSEVALRANQKVDQSYLDACFTCSPSCCEQDSNDEYAKDIGYSQEELEELPEAVVGACAGCGNPTALAGLCEGEVVLDLGSGGGIDVFLAAKKVGPSGRVIGVDMTEEMVELARINAAKMGLANVEFRLGEIEDLPVDDESIDVIISNCVINLSPDKDKVFNEAYRILRPGGRMIISDTVSEGELPQEIRSDPDAWAGCVAGALDESLYLEKIRDAGFIDVKVLTRKPFMEIVNSIEVEAHKPKG